MSDGVTRTDLTDKVTFEQGSEGGGGTSHEGISWKNVLGSRISSCKGSEAGACPVCSQKSQVAETRMAGVKRIEEGVRGDGARQERGQTVLATQTALLIWAARKLRESHQADGGVWVWQLQGGGGWMYTECRGPSPCLGLQAGNWRVRGDRGRLPLGRAGGQGAWTCTVCVRASLLGRLGIIKYKVLVMPAFRLMGLRQGWG